MGWIREHLVGLLALCVAVLAAAGGVIAFAMTTLATTADIERMTASLATKADLAALPTVANFGTVVETVVTLREAAAAVSATVEAISETVEAQRETIDMLSAVVAEQREITDKLGAVVEAQRETIDMLSVAVAEQRETTDRLGAVVEALARPPTR